MAKYDSIGSGYDDTRRADPYLLERLLYLLNPEIGKSYLDIGCGTGNYTSALFQKGFDFIGIDPSEKMLSEAKQRNPNINWQLGTAEEIPFGNNSFDGIIATLTIHHWTSLEKSFAEISRVLKTDGRMVIFTSTPIQMKGYWLNHYFPQLLETSIAQMPAMEAIEEAIGKSGLKIVETKKYSVKDDLQDGFLYIGKNRPELYFEEKIRNGISSFMSLSNAEEVGSGLEKLKSGIADGKFEKIKQRYENAFGDYLFIVIGKVVT